MQFGFDKFYIFFLHLLSSSELNIDIDNLWKFGIEFIKNLTVKTTNGFWIDVSKVYNAKCENVSDVYCDNLWYYSKITVDGRSVFSESLYN